MSQSESTQPDKTVPDIPDTTASTEAEREDSRLRVAARVFQNGKTAAQQWYRQGRSAAERFSGSAGERIKNDPVRSAAVTFVIGITLGALIGWSLANSSGGPVRLDMDQ